MDRSNLYYPILDPEGKDCYPMLNKNEEDCWYWVQETMKENIEKGLVEFKKKMGIGFHMKKYISQRKGKK